MGISILCKALLCVALGWGMAPGYAGGRVAAGSEISRPQITSLVIALEDGRSYALSAQELAEPMGGAIFWGDWAVSNLLVPQYLCRPRSPMNAAEVMRLWFTVGASGELPAFLVHTLAGPVYPLDPGGPKESGWVFSFRPRPQVAQITVGYADGRMFTLSERILRDSKSGVMVWTDFAVANLLIPFYRGERHLPTRPEDVMRTWNQPVAAPSRKGLVEELEFPGFLVKPACIPSYPLGTPNS